MFEVRAAFEILPKEKQFADSLRFTVRNNTPEIINRQTDISINGQTEKLNLNAAPFSDTEEIILKSKATTTGSN